MKIDFETVIYLLITLVFVIVGVFGKKKRPPLPAPVGGQEDPSIGEVEQRSELNRDDLNELFGIMKNKGSKAMVDTETLYKSRLEEYARITKDENAREYQKEALSEEVMLDSPVSSLDTAYGYLDSVDYVESIEGISMIDSSEEIEDIIKLTEMGSANEQASSKSPVDDLLRSFSAKAAIVYSEILNPKYF